MGGKKKGGGGKGKGKGAAPDEDDVSMDNFFKFYKRKCTELEVAQSPIIKDKQELWQDEQEIPTKFHIWTELGWPGTRALMDALVMAKYQHC